jgi:hypothetical protein
LVQEKAGRGEEAEATLRHAVTLAEAALGHRSPDAAFALGALAAFLKCAPAAPAAPRSAAHVAVGWDGACVAHWRHANDAASAAHAAAASPHAAPRWCAAGAA